MPLTLEPNAIVGGRYRLLRFLGRGGMGEVWAAEQTVTRKHVALKFLSGVERGHGGDAASEANESNKKRFLREARAACAVSHPNVVQIHDVIEVDEGIPAMVMELLVGESLESKLKRDGKLSARETIAVMARVVSAVGTAHTHGVIHRDLKPDNIFLVETPDGTDVKVLDFGIAKIGSTEDGSQTGALTATGTMLGTPYYMSPEQAFGEKKIDHRADIWSLGIVMFRCLTGTLPTQADNLGQILKIIMTQSIPKLALVEPSAPPELTAMIDKMLSYAAKDRPADLREVREVLDRLATSEVADFGPPKPETLAVTTGDVTSSSVTSAGVAKANGPTEETARPIRPAVWALGAAVALSLVTAFVVVFGKHGSAASQRTSSTLDNASASAPTSVSAESTSVPLPVAQSAVSSTASTSVPNAASSAIPTTTLAPSVATPVANHAPSKPSPGASQAPSATPPSGPVPTSMGGIVTQNPFQR